MLRLGFGLFIPRVSGDPAVPSTFLPTLSVDGSAGIHVFPRRQQNDETDVSAAGTVVTAERVSAGGDTITTAWVYATNLVPGRVYDLAMTINFLANAGGTRRVRVNRLSHLGSWGGIGIGAWDHEVNLDGAGAATEAVSTSFTAQGDWAWIEITSTAQATGDVWTLDTSTFSLTPQDTLMDVPHALPAESGVIPVVFPEWRTQGRYRISFDVSGATGQTDVYLCRRNNSTARTATAIATDGANVAILENRFEHWRGTDGCSIANFEALAMHGLCYLHVTSAGGTPTITNLTLTRVSDGTWTPDAYGRFPTFSVEGGSIWPHTEAAWTAPTSGTLTQVADQAAFDAAISALSVATDGPTVFAGGARIEVADGAEISLSGLSDLHFKAPVYIYPQTWLGATITAADTTGLRNVHISGFRSDASFTLRGARECSLRWLGGSFMLFANSGETDHWLARQIAIENNALFGWPFPDDNAEPKNPLVFDPVVQLRVRGNRVGFGREDMLRGHWSVSDVRRNMFSPFDDKIPQHPDGIQLFAQPVRNAELTLPVHDIHFAENVIQHTRAYSDSSLGVAIGDAVGGAVRWVFENNIVQATSTAMLFEDVLNGIVSNNSTPTGPFNTIRGRGTGIDYTFANNIGFKVPDTGNSATDYFGFTASNNYAYDSDGGFSAYYIGQLQFSQSVFDALQDRTSDPWLAGAGPQDLDDELVALEVSTPDAIPPAAIEVEITDRYMLRARATMLPAGADMRLKRWERRIDGGAWESHYVNEWGVNPVDVPLLGISAGAHTLELRAVAQKVSDGLGTEYPGASSGNVSFTVPANPAAAVADRVEQDIAWSWHIEQGAVYDSARGRVLVGTTAANNFNDVTGTVAGAQYVLEMDATSGEVLSRTRFGSHTVGYVNGETSDDHNAPAMCLNSTGRLIVVGTGHNDVQNFWAAWSTDSNPANLGSATSVSTADDATYVQLVRRGTAIYAFLQVTTSKWVCYINASDGDPTAWTLVGDTLTSANQTYMRVVAPEGLASAARGLAWDHPTNVGADRGKIRYVEVDLTNVQSQTQASLPVLFTPPSGESSRVLSVNDDVTAFLYVRFTVGTHTGQTYWIARLTGTDRADPADWSHESLGETTESSFWESSHYVAGGELIGSGINDIALWLCRDAGDGTHRLEHWARYRRDDPWVVTELYSSSRILARPLQPRGYRDFALVQEIDSYTTFADGWKMRALAIPAVVGGDFSTVTYDSVAPSVVTEVSRSEAIYLSAPDTSNQDLTISALGDAVDGDVAAVTVLTRYPVDSGTAPVVTIGGEAATLRTQEVFQEAGVQTYFAGVYTVTCPPGGLTTTVNINSGSSGGVASYQAAGGWVLRGAVEAPFSVAKTDGTQDTIFTVANGRIIGAALSSGGPSAPHVYTGVATRHTRTQIGSDNVYSYGSGATTPQLDLVVDVSEGTAFSMVGVFASFEPA